MPDAARFTHNGRQVIIAVWGLALGFPIVFLAAAIPAILTGETSLMLVMLGLGIAGAALFTLVFATWTTNTFNLY
jgi:cytosine permease